MAPRLKPFEGSATDSDHKVFFWARLKLTGIYVGILALILLGFSLVLFQSVAHNLNDADEGDFAGPDSHHHFVQHTLDSVQNEIVLIDVFILIAAAGASYVLAGYTLRPIQRSLEAQKKFSENASHELRTPLAVMKNDMEVLLRNPSPVKEAVQSTLRSSIDEIDRLSTMAKDLLTLARSGIQTATTEEARVELKALIEKEMEKLEPIAEEKGITMSFVKAEAFYVRGHPSNFERMILNLLQNAIEHTPRGASISVGLTEENKQAVISITDTGSGIPAKDLPHVFDRFYKGERSNGTGLGLAIVKELAEQSSGSAMLESEVGKGTTARLKFPLA
ncbi:MAG: HAMP domain-containing histidine kinase [Patescibacteria group bacterium]|nr:HAMP domain-containing histidine kinase [Patescibacteria group bacterium]